MTQRERIMALVALALIVVFGGGFMGYQVVLRPLQQKEKAIQALRDDVEKGETTLDEFTRNRPRLELMKKLSLPADQDVARSKYVEELIRLLRVSDFPESSTVTPKPVERAPTGPGAKKPAFTRLQFDVQAHGEEASLIEFLDHFYRTPLLHRIRTLTVNKPVASQTRQGGILDISILIEALIVEGAEKRDSLLPKGVEAPPRLARAGDMYATIAGRNIFFGLTADRSDVEVRQRDTVVDPSEYVRLAAITHDSNGDDACLYDVYNNCKYDIHRTKGGTVSVRKCIYFKQKPVLHDFADELVFKDDDGTTHGSYKVVRIDSQELLLEADGNYYRLHVGWSMKELRKITSEAELKQYGLPVKIKKTDESKEEKKTTKVAEK